jgi:DNA-binding winged helix-turn-helix (wHTH) protein
MRRLWPGTFVEEANLAKHVSILKKILSEATNGREYIETIPKRGYRFVAEVREVAEAETGFQPQAIPGVGDVFAATGCASTGESRNRLWRVGLLTMVLLR